MFIGIPVYLFLDRKESVERETFGDIEKEVRNNTAGSVSIGKERSYLLLNRITMNDEDEYRDILKSLALEGDITWTLVGL